MSAIHLLKCFSAIARRCLVIAGMLALIGCGSIRIASAAEATTSAPPAFEWNVYLGNWQVIGPFPKLDRDQSSTELVRALVKDEAELRPDANITVDGKQFEWHKWPGRMVDFIAALDIDLADGQYALAYAYTEFTSDTEQDAILAISHDDCARVWLNGKEIHNKDAWVSSELDQVTIPVKLQKGTNRLLAKVCQGYGNWEFAARLRPTDLEKPLISIGANGASNGDMSRLPLVEIDLLDNEGNVRTTWATSGGRSGGSGVRYTLYATPPDPAPERIRVHFDTRGFVPYEKEYAWQQALSGSIWITLAAKDRIHGRVVDEKSGKPVEGAEILSGQSPVAKKTDAEGRFEFTMKDPLADIVEVRARGYEPMEVRAVHDGEWTIKVAPGGHIFRGRVLTKDGKPIAGARLTTYTLRRDVNLTTDGEGKFELTGIPGSETGLYLTVSHPEYIAKDGFTQSLDEDGLTEVEWQLETGCVIEGRVTDKSSGEPLSGIEIISGTDHFSSDETNPKTYTDADGRFRLGGLEAGSVLVHAFSEDFVPTVSTVTTSHEQTATANFELTTGEAISGRVVDPDGKPVAGVTLAIDTINGSRMLDRRVNTNAKGEFRYENMPDTPVKIDMFKNGYVSKRDFESRGGEHTEITLYPVVEHVVNVRLSDTNEPPQELSSQLGYQWQGQTEVSWQERDYSSNSSYDSATGTFRISVNEPSSGSKLFFRLRAPGYREVVIDNPELGTPAKTWDVVLEKVASTRGRVVSAETGEPIDGVVVALANKEDRLRMDHFVNFNDNYGALEQFTGVRATTNENGSFEISQTAPGQFTDLVLFRKGGGFHCIPNAASVLTGDVELPLPAAGSIAGRVIVADEPRADEIVHVSWIGHGDRSMSYDQPFGFGGQMRTDSKGRFKFPGLGPGRYQLSRVRSFDYPSGRGSMSSYLSGEEILVLPGQDVTYDFIQRAGYKVSGRTIDTDGKPLANCQVAIRKTTDQTGRLDVVFTDSDGTFEIEHLQSGNYAISAEQYLPNEWGGFNNGGGQGTGTAKIVDQDVTTDIKIAARSAAQIARVNQPEATTLVGAVPPDFTGKLVGSDKSFSLSDHYGKVVAIDFWATWCGPCMAVMPEMKQLYEKYKDSDEVVFVTVSLDQDAETLTSTMKEQGIEFPVIYESREASQAIANSFGVRGIPSSFVIGRDGRFASERVHGSQLVAATEAAAKAQTKNVFGEGVKPSRLAIKLALDDAAGVPGAEITLKAFDEIGMPVHEETLRTAGQSQQVTWLYPPLEEGGKIEVAVAAKDLPTQEKTVSSPREQAEVEFAFVSPRAISGMVSVKEDDGEIPAVGLKVTAYRTDGLVRSAMTDAEGKFSIRVMPGSYYVSPAGNDEFAPVARNREQIEVTADADPEPLAVEACRTVTAKGTVVDEDEQPVAGAKVRTSGSEKIVTTDDQGRFELPGVPSQGTVQLYAFLKPKVATVTLEDFDGKEPQTLTLGDQPSGRGDGKLSEGLKAPPLKVVTVADEEPVDWRPGERDALVVFGPLWHPATRKMLTEAKAWVDDHQAELVVVSTDWSIDQARRELAHYGDALPDRNAILFAGPGGLALSKAWGLQAAPQAYLVSPKGKITAAPAPGSLPQ